MGTKNNIVVLSISCFFVVADMKHEYFLGLVDQTVLH
jgi:hypothetical protein